MSTEAASAVSRETVATLSPGDQVQFGDERYEWGSPLNVVDVADPVEWDVPFGENWWTRELTVEGSTGHRVVVTVADTGDDEPLAKSYRLHDGELDFRGEVLYLTPVEDELDPADLRPDGLTEACIHSVAEHYGTIEEVADDFGVDVDRAEAILEAHECVDEVVLDA